MVGFADELEAEAREAHPCRVETVRQNMGTIDRKVFDAALANVEGVSTGAIMRALQKDPANKAGGRGLGRQAILKHRNNLCACYAEGDS